MTKAAYRRKGLGGLTVADVDFPMAREAWNHAAGSGSRSSITDMKWGGSKQEEGPHYEFSKSAPSKAVSSQTMSLTRD